MNPRYRRGASGTEWETIGFETWQQPRCDALPPVNISALWAQVARIRAREGDREGAARARVSVKMASRSPGPLRRTKVQDIITLTAHFRAEDGPACHNAQEGTRITSDPALVECGNCRRTRAWRAACQDVAPAAEK